MYKYLLLCPLCFFTMLSCAQKSPSKLPVLQIETIGEKSDLSVLGKIPYYASGWSESRISVDDERLLRFFDIPVDKVDLDFDNKGGVVSSIDIVFFEKDSIAVLSLLREKFGEEMKPEDDYYGNSDDKLVWKVKNITYKYDNSFGNPDLHIKFEEEIGGVYEY